MERYISANRAELSIIGSPEANVAIIRRYVDAPLRDVRGFVGIADRVIELVRTSAGLDCCGWAQS